MKMGLSKIKKKEKRFKDYSQIVFKIVCFQLNNTENIKKHKRSKVYRKLHHDSLKLIFFQSLHHSINKQTNFLLYYKNCIDVLYLVLFHLESKIEFIWANFKAQLYDIHKNLI